MTVTKLIHRLVEGEKSRDNEVIGQNKKSSFILSVSLRKKFYEKWDCTKCDSSFFYKMIRCPLCESSKINQKVLECVKPGMAH